MSPLLALHFTDFTTPQLWKTKFQYIQGEGSLFQAVRGKWHGAYFGHGTFEWSRAVQALCELMIQACVNESGDTPDLVGGTHSFASSLDYSLYKQPNWMLEMFGPDIRGNTQLRRLILRSNPGRKMRGPVALSLNRTLLPPSTIEIIVGDRRIEDKSLVTNLQLALKRGRIDPNSIAA